MSHLGISLLMQLRRLPKYCRILLCLCILPIATILIYIYCYENYFQSLNFPNLFQTGDIVLLGNQTLRGLLVRTTNATSSYAHVAMVECNADGCFLLHADPQAGCIEESIQKYFSQNRVSVLTILRPKASRQVINRAILFARESTKRNLPFNNKLRYGAGQGFYCTEFVLEAYNAAKYPLLENAKKGDIIRPEKLLQSKALDLVIVKHADDNS